MHSDEWGPQLEWMRTVPRRIALRASRAFCEPFGLRETRGANTADSVLNHLALRSTLTLSRVLYVAAANPIEAHRRHLRNGNCKAKGKRFAASFAQR